MKVLFLDESGDHNLSVIDPQYPLFVLGGVIVEHDYAEGSLTDELNAFKQTLFGHTDIILHTADITRNRNGFEGLKDAAFRSQFYDALNALMRGLQYSIVACVIRKNEHLSRYGVAALDPYGGVIVAERRDPTLDREMDLAWLNLKIQGTRYLQAKQISDRIVGLNLRPKSDNIAGLQLADLVVSPIGRHVMGKPDKEDWTIVHEKMRRSQSGRVEGHGLLCCHNKSGQPPLRSDQPITTRWVESTSMSRRPDPQGLTFVDVTALSHWLARLRHDVPHRPDLGHAPQSREAVL